MNAISLFSGIGGLDIGFSAAGFNIIAQVEIDPFCRNVLRRHSAEWWPNAVHFADVFDFGRYSVTGDIAVIFGGFPCQPHSVAGKRKGAEDSRDLWPQFRRVIGEIRPRCVLLENVPGIISTGYAAIVTGDLAALGYDAQWGIVSAADAGAPHKRERWFCVAYASNLRCNTRRSEQPLQRSGPYGEAQPLAYTSFKRLPHITQRSNKIPVIASSNKSVANSPKLRCHRDTTQPGSIATRPNKGRVFQPTRTRWQRRVTRSRLGRDADGVPCWLDRPRWPADQGEAQYDYEPPRTVARSQTHRAARVKALGNAVVPQVAYALAVVIRQQLEGKFNGS